MNNKRELVPLLGAVLISGFLVSLAWIWSIYKNDSWYESCGIISKNICLVNYVSSIGEP